MLLRVRYLLEQPGRSPLLSEEILVTAVTNIWASTEPDWLSDEEALRLLAEARPDANIPITEKRELVAASLKAWPAMERTLQKRITERAKELEKSHKRVRRAASLKVRDLALNPQLPSDLLGILVLQPVA
jgi:hypothetical protein